MEPIAEIIKEGSGSLWILLPMALALGGLHGLEPGHSKTMMAAFIIAVRGTVPQAILLGLSAAFSHVIIVWALALAALTWGREFADEELEPWMMLGSGAIIIGVAAWMAWRAWRDMKAAHEHHHHHHHGHHHGHDHHHGHHHRHEEDTEFLDAHQQFHANQIQEKYQGAQVTTGQVVLFGLTGGLLPCAAAVTVLLVCLHLDRFWLGVSMVGAFSVGLAVTLVAVGVVAAWGVGRASKRWGGFDRLARRLPLLSSGLIALIGAFMAWSGARALGVI